MQRHEDIPRRWFPRGLLPSAQHHLEAQNQELLSQLKLVITPHQLRHPHRQNILRHLKVDLPNIPLSLIENLLLLYLHYHRQ